MVTELATVVSHVLTVTYAAIYPSDAPDAVVVQPTPVRHVDELVQAATSGIVSAQGIAPHLMHALGFSREEVEAELARAEEARKAGAAAAAAAEATAAGEGEGAPSLAGAPAAAPAADPEAPSPKANGAS
jgi:hypothetical protein